MAWYQISMVCNNVAMAANKMASIINYQYPSISNNGNGIIIIIGNIESS